MFNYENLSDYEFELLSCDIMSRKLGVKLYTFAKGRDGGIDVTDNVSTHNIIIQVKHYLKSNISSLMTSLKNEVSKVKQLCPNQYYICCAQRLSAPKIDEIYNLFSNYMASPANIVSLSEFDSFLEDLNNSDILKKHYKLWLESTNILSQIYNRNIFIDCESLLYEINEESKSFVKTIYYDKCLQVLENNRILLILGLPGVGKTVTTKMLALFYATNKYQIRYTTDGEITNLKKALSESEDLPELIILDDCLGQTYFKMKETQENELISLIRYISMKPKKKLIMNSRVTIYNEAKSRSIVFNKFTEDKDDLITTIDMSNLPAEEKGLIFYNHLYFKDVPSPYYNNIIYDKNYRKIVLHHNYTPRIIEYVTNTNRIANISPEEYANFILSCLDNPTEIWSNEYNKRLSMEDRLFITTLYSLTETEVEESIFRRAYNYRLHNRKCIDTTRNFFDESLIHLNNSMVMIIDKNDKRMISVINPSVNDFLKEALSKNPIEFDDIKQNCSEYIQVKRLFPSLFAEFVASGDADTLNYQSTIERTYIILTCICQYSIKSQECQYIINTFLNELNYALIEACYTRSAILCYLLSNSMDSFYYTRANISTETLIDYFKSMDLDEYSELIKHVQENNILFLITKNEEYFTDGLNNAIASYCQNVPGDEYYENYDFSDIIESCTDSKDILIYSSYGDPYVDQEYSINSLKAEKIVLEMIEEDLISEIKEKLKLLPSEYDDKIKRVPDKFDIDIHGLDSHIESYLEPDDPDYEYEPHSSTNFSGDPLDYIFK